MSIDLNRRTLVLAAGAAALGCVGGVAAGAGEGRVIDIVAKKFEYVPNEIRVKRGEAVQLRFTAPEVTMGFNLPDFKVRADLLPGQVTTVQLAPDRAGTFTFACDIFCGSGHEDMSGTLIVA